MNTPFGFDEENECFFKLRKLLTMYFKSLDGTVMTDCQAGLGLYCAEAAAQEGCDLVCVAPYENQAEKWTPQLRERYFSLHEKARLVTILSTAYTESCMDEAQLYIAHNCDEMIVLKCESEPLPLGAQRALKLKKNVTVIDCEKFTIENPA